MACSNDLKNNELIREKNLFYLKRQDTKKVRVKNNNSPLFGLRRKKIAKRGRVEKENTKKKEVLIIQIIFSS